MTETNLQNFDLSDLTLDEYDDEYSYVVDIRDHRVRNGKVEWLVQFRDSEREWVPDAQCNCECKIQDYLESLPNRAMTTVYMVCRVSSKSQTGPTHVSLEVQQRKLFEVVGEMKFDTPVIRSRLVRISESAYKGIPEKLQEVAEYARRGDVIMVYRADRLSRNINMFLTMLDDLTERGVRVYTNEENLWYDTNPIEFMQFILNGQRESNMISRRVRAALAMKRARGDHMGAVPFGYSRVRDETGKQVLVVNKEEQVVLKQITGLLQQGRGSYHYVVQKLQDLGSTFRGKPWTTQRVSRVMPW